MSKNTNCCQFPSPLLLLCLRLFRLLSRVKWNPQKKTMDIITVLVTHSSTGVSNWFSRSSIHYSGCPAVCRCRSSHVEPRERSSSHLPAGAHSSLENQVSLLNGRRLEAMTRPDHSLCLWGRAGGLYLSSFYQAGLISGRTMRRRRGRLAPLVSSV